MNVFIAGIMGNMGSRYMKILSQMPKLNIYGWDREVSFVQQAEFCRQKNVDRIIIATPTSTHVDALNLFTSICPHIPILCEKPIARQALDGSPDNLTMVNQYAYLVDPDSIGKTYYNYWKTGNDGLYWDCINIIGMANGDVEVKADSPIWQCQINGKQLSLADMDQAYVDMIEDWVKEPIPNGDYIDHAHMAVEDYIEGRKSKGPYINIPEENNLADVLPFAGKKV